MRPANGIPTTVGKIMKREMLIDAVHAEQKRMAIVEDGKLVEFDIQMSFKQPITGNIYKGKVLKVERGLQAAFVNFGVKKDGFLPLRDISPEYFTEPNGKNREQGSARPILKTGQELLVQVLREVSGQKGALLTAYISLPGRYLVLLPNKGSSGVSRKIEDEGDRKRLKDIVEQIKKEEGLGFIVRTAGMNRTKQELTRDYQHLLRLWLEIQKKAKAVSAPALIYQESDFGVRTLRDYFTPEISTIWVDDLETFKEMRVYSKAIAPRTTKIIQLYKEKTPIFDQYQLEDQIRSIYQERVALKSGGSVIIKPTEAMITIDVNSGKGSHKRNVEETAYKTNMEAAEEIARQLRLRDLGGLIVIDFIDMMDRKNVAEVEKTFKKALSIDRARIQLARISKFGILELSRQKKHSTIQEISYITCPHCSGSGIRPSLEYVALSAFRKMESQAVKGTASSLTVSLPYEVAGYLLNQKRSEILKLEAEYDMTINILAVPNMAWDAVTIETIPRKAMLEMPEAKRTPAAGLSEQLEIEEDGEEEATLEEPELQKEAGEAAPTAEGGEALPRRKSRRRRRNRRRRPPVVPSLPLEAGSAEAAATVPEAFGETVLPAAEAAAIPVEQEAVVEFPPAETGLPGPKRPAPRHRRKKATIPAATAMAAEQEQEGGGEATAPVLPVEAGQEPKRSPARHRRKKTVPHTPVTAAPEPESNPETVSLPPAVETSPAAKRPSAHRRRRKVAATALPEATEQPPFLEIRETAVAEPPKRKRPYSARQRTKKSAEVAPDAAMTAEEK